MFFIKKKNAGLYKYDDLIPDISWISSPSLMLPAQNHAEAYKQANNNKYINTIIHVPDAVVHYYDRASAWLRSESAPCP